MFIMLDKYAFLHQLMELRYMHMKKLSCLQSGTFLIWEMPKMVGNVEFSLLALLQDTTITSARPPINAQ